MKKTRPIEKILKELADERNLNYETYANGWIIKIGNKLVMGYHFSLNNAASSRLCDDKSAATSYLASAGFPVIPHEFFMEIDEIRFLAMINSYGDELVVKPNQGTAGNEVTRTSNLHDLIASAQRILSGGSALAVSPFLNLKNEFRIVVLNQKAELIYSKEIQSGWKHNLSLGAKPILIDTFPELVELALKATKALDINFASVDIVESEEGFKILEINSGVMMDIFSSISEENYQIAKNIYRKALLLN